MEKVQFRVGSAVRKSLLMILVSILLLTIILSEVALSQAEKADRQKIIREVAQKWIEIGIEQYERGLYKAAERSFLRAQNYEEYLTADQRKKLSKLLEKAHIAMLERERILEHIQAANKLVDQGQLIRAKAHLQKVKDSEYLTEQERKQIAEGLEKLNQQLQQQKREIAELYNRSVELYQAGQLEQAREGFIKVARSGLMVAPEGKTAEDYLMKIDKILGRKAPPPPSIEMEPEERLLEPAITVIEEDELLKIEAEPEIIKRRPVTVAKPEVVKPVKEVTYIEVINRKRNILRSHTRAVVNDAVAKAQKYMAQGEFDKAKEAIETAERTVNRNQLYLGDELFKQYSLQLKQISEEIVQRQDERARQLEEQQQLEAIEAQRRLREQMEIDRERRIAELMESAMAFQKQQRYEEALGQLESLLAIDPLNDEALILKQTLEDMIYFRKQLETQKEASKERTELLLRTDESMIPYAEELTYPKDWREIAAKRKPEEAIGFNPADVAVFKQLEQIVDLRQLTPETPFGDAIEIIRNSVEPPLKIYVLWRSLYETADIDRDTAINMEGEIAPLRRTLELLLKSLSTPFAELGYVVEDGVITIATIEQLPSELTTLVYDVSDLLGRAAAYYTRAARGRGVISRAEEAVEYFEEEEEMLQREQLEERARARAEGLVELIMYTVEPDSWYEIGTGEGTITVYENKKLIVRQTRDIHNKIAKLLKDLRKALGYQVAIEARFLSVSENFLEDIGLDIDFAVRLGGKWRHPTIGLLAVPPQPYPGITFDQGSSGFTIPEGTGVPGSLGAVGNAMTVMGGWGTILDDLQVNFLLKATQARRDATFLTAPKVSVLSGESATLRVQRTIRYARDIDVEVREAGEWLPRATWTVDYEPGAIPTGAILNITPTITPDKKYVLLNIWAEVRDFLGWRRQAVDLPIFGIEEAEEYTIEFPETEISRIATRVSVPDGGTLLLGGQKVAGKVEKEAGVPILSKIPLIGRLFTNRSTIKDEKVLLILVKPTIILQEEAEAEAIAAVEDQF